MKITRIPSEKDSRPAGGTSDLSPLINNCALPEGGAMLAGCSAAIHRGLRFIALVLLICCTHMMLTAQNRTIYVSDAGNFNLPPWQILKFDEDGGNGEVFISDHLAWPQDIVFLEDRDQVLISNLNTGTIARFNEGTGAYINDFATGIGGPTRMKIGPDGLLYVLQWVGNGRVWRYNLDGTFVDQFTDAGVNQSIGMDWDSEGNLYISSYNGGFVRKFNASGEDQGNFISSNLTGPTNIWFAANGDLLVVDYNGGSVKRFDSNGIFLSVFISSLAQGEGVDFLPNGNIIIGSGGASSVRMYNQAGTFLSNLVPPGTLGLITPNAVVIRTEGTSSIADPGKYEEMVLATPTIGTQFQISAGDLHSADTQIVVSNIAGIAVTTIRLAHTSSWDASNLTDGVYYLTVQLGDGAIGRQKIVIQR